MATIKKSGLVLKQLLKTAVGGGKFESVRQGSYQASKLVYSEYGEPLKVVTQVNELLSESDIQPDQVLVKMLAAPVNPADINTIEGKYPARPDLPAVPGNEGVGEVLRVGANVRKFTVGDRVVPLVQGLGTWRTHAVFKENETMKVPAKLGLAEAATLTVNPCTAYRMLRDFGTLKPGNTIIQNGANSACGQYVIQIARVWGLRSVNIVRDRSEIDELKKYLKDLGATVVLTEEELRRTEIFKTNKVERPKLALNCVGGKSAVEIMRQLQTGCPMVTYGGMSREPVVVPTSSLIFKDVKICGFWMTRWTKTNAESEERQEMFDEIISMMTTNELKGMVCERVKFADYKNALGNALNLKGMVGKKFLLTFD